MLPHISIKERSIQKITDVLIHKRFRKKYEYFKISHNVVISEKQKVIRSKGV